MSIEVRHLVVKIIVGQENQSPVSSFLQEYDINKLKTQVLRQCKEMIIDIIRREKER